MRPRPKPLQASVHLPHHPHWTQVSVCSYGKTSQYQTGGCLDYDLACCVCVCRCVCAPGYVGDDCGLDYNDCEDHRCQNGAQCVDELNGYSCVCHRGYRYEATSRFFSQPFSASLKGESCLRSGQLCEVAPSLLSVCELADCQNNAPCVERGGRALCQCPPEFGGPRCEKLVSVNFVDRDSYLLLSDLKNWPQANITLQVSREGADASTCFQAGLSSEA